MCGILGVWERKRAVSLGRLTAATKKLVHRGPDGQHHWMAKQGDVALAHTRLSVMGGDTGVQPLMSEDGSLVAVVNGEFYEYESIRRELEAEGYEFRTRSDSEIILPLYRKFGVSFVESLRGEFAFLLWDARQRRLVAGRDRFGVKPLYYNISHDHFYAASEAKALFELGVTREWNHDAVLKNDNLFLVSPHESFFKGIQQVAPGHLHIISDEGMRKVQYWDLNRNSACEGKENYSPSEYIEEYRALLNEAVRVRMRSDVPVGFYVSGGLDSSAIFALAANMSSKRLDTFTIGFGESAYDESGIAKRMTESYGAKEHLLLVNDQNIAQSFADTVECCEAPMFNTHSIAKYLLSREVRETGLKAVMTGEGADDLLGGYAFLRKDLIGAEHGFNTPEANRMVADLFARNSIYGPLFNSQDADVLSNVRQRLGYTPCFLETGALYQMRMRDLYSGEFRAYSQGRDVFGELLDSLENTWSSPPAAPKLSTHLWVNTHLSSYILSVVGDRVEMANSVEGRLPFLDHKLAEFTACVPASLKLNDGIEKYILKEAVRDVVTSTVYKRQKQPFLAPPACANRHGKVFEFISDTIHGRCMHELPFYERRKAIDLLEAAPNSDLETQKFLDKALLQIASLCIMQERFGLT